MKIIVITSLISIMLFCNVSAGTDGKNNLSKNPKPTKDCFENLNRATFALNQGLDKVIFKPIAKSYRGLPSSVRTGTNNVIVNLYSRIFIKGS